MTLIDAVNRASEKKPNKPFLILEKEKVTFKKFKEDMERLSSGFTRLGIKKGDKIAMLLCNSIEFVVCYFAAVRAGAIIVPLNNFLSLEEVVYILNDAKVKIFISSSDCFDVIKELKINAVPQLEHIILTDNIDGMKYKRYRDILESGAGTVEPPAEMDENEVAVIIYTSGTTGHPKGAMLTHRNLLSNADSSITRIEVVEKDKFILFLPMFHAFTFTVCIIIPLYQLCTTVILKSIKPFGKIIGAIMFKRITVFVAIPPVYNVLSGKKIPKLLLWFNPIRVCVSGAAPLSSEVLKSFEEKFGIPLLEGYGLSEASPVVSVNPLEGVRKIGSVGPAIPGVKIKIVDEDGKDLKAGEEGEIAVSGPNVMKGYYDRPEETREVMKDGWLLTGDIGKLDEQGYLYILDRKKDLILVNGMNLYPREVEDILYRHPAIEDVAVVGKKDDVHGEVPVCVVKLRDGMTATEADLKKFCKPHLANFKVPHRFEFWPELPKTGTGKVIKREVRRLINEKK